MCGRGPEGGPGNPSFLEGTAKLPVHFQALGKRYPEDGTKSVMVITKNIGCRGAVRGNRKEGESYGSHSQRENQRQW